MWGPLITGAIALYVNYKARQQSSDANNAALAQQEAANAEAKRASAPAVAYLKSVVARGDALTPIQHQYVADTRQQTGRDLSSRLGGRSATAIASRAALDVENNTTIANQKRADDAAVALANPNTSGAALALGMGQDRANAARNSGALTAGSTLAAGQLIAQGIGSYYSRKSNQDFIDAIRSNQARPGAYDNQKPDYAWSPNYSLIQARPGGDAPPKPDNEWNPDYSLSTATF